ncbi:flagellar biosynthesis repressor FlbT [Marivita sp. XM-24bin2]|jgi:flagellar protein FlbT|uniref:flagellar biosynthesis repressor FlbT n=1 Tax=unclassified Marivita TaxID=2632480 RepID=UPI000D7B8F28|nr:flagellar biosynthesis repressor FlbT [Marivita sp. XM-24bin2]MCR9109663.1 flagellar biosynthesis repressor FlbT [Paracoccaceae bacterium]PWL34983.1 MAG: flagellar biosynthesis repressor FlbT [Marivita sp. XM-24bin2]
MSGLVLKMGPKERVLINGAVIENGDHRSRITVLTSKANILRLKDAIHPDEANTPVRRACYLAQLILSGEVDPVTLWVRLSGQVQTLAEILSDDHSAALLLKASDAISDQNAYACLKLLRQLLPIESHLLRARGQ